MRMPAAISPKMIAATTQSTTMQNGGHHRVLATRWVRCCQRSLSPWPAKPATSSHGDPVTVAMATTTSANLTLLDGDDLHPSVGNLQATIFKALAYVPPRPGWMAMCR